MDRERFSRRSRTLDLELLPGDAVAFEVTLVDESFGGDHEAADSEALVVHHFVIEGVAAGDDVRLSELRVRAEQHPFPQCPLIAPAAASLIGLSLTTDWRRSVLERFRGSAGCTHVTTLLLGLSELITLIYFQRMNRRAAYGPENRASGKWIAGSLAEGQDLSGACHVLRRDGSVLRRAESFQDRRGSQA